MTFVHQTGTVLYWYHRIMRHIRCRSDCPTPATPYRWPERTAPECTRFRKILLTSTRRWWWLCSPASWSQIFNQSRKTHIRQFYSSSIHFIYRFEQMIHVKVMVNNGPIRKQKIPFQLLVVSFTALPFYFPTFLIIAKRHVEQTFLKLDQRLFGFISDMKIYS